MEKQALEDVVVTAQVCAAHTAGVIQVGVGTFQPLPTGAEQACAALAVNPSPIAIDGVAVGSLIDPSLRGPIRLADVGAEPDLVEFPHLASAVIALVGDDLVDDLNRRSGRVLQIDQGVNRVCQRPINRRGVALISALHRHRDDRAGLEIDRVLGLVGQMRAAHFSSS